MSCRPPCQDEPCSSLDTLVSNRDPKKRDKAWLENMVRFLSNLVLQLCGRIKTNVWNEQNKPKWWPKKLTWKNPTANKKDKRKILIKKFLALEKYLISIGQFPEQLKDQAELWRAGKTEELFLLAELISNINKLETIQKSVAQCIEKPEINHSMCRSYINRFTNCLKTFSEDLELKVTESVGVKRYSSDDGNENNLVPSKKRKEEHHFLNLESLPQKSLKDKDLNLDAQITNTEAATSDDDNMTSIIDDISGSQTLNKTEYVLNMPSSEIMHSSSRSLNSNNEPSLSSNISAFIVPPIDPNNDLVIPLKTDVPPPSDRHLFPQALDTALINIPSECDLSNKFLHRSSNSDTDLCVLSVNEQVMETLIHTNSDVISESPADFENTSASVQLDLITDVTNQCVVNKNIDFFCQDDESRFSNSNSEQSFYSKVNEICSTSATSDHVTPLTEENCNMVDLWTNNANSIQQPLPDLHDEDLNQGFNDNPFDPKDLLQNLSDYTFDPEDRFSEFNDCPFDS